MATEKTIDVGTVPIVSTLEASGRIFAYTGNGSLCCIPKDNLMNEVTKIRHSHTDSNEWVRVAGINTVGYSYAGLLAISGAWNNGAPGAAIIALTLKASGADFTDSATLVSGAPGFSFRKIRLVRSEGSCFIDVFRAAAGSTSIHVSLMPNNSDAIIYDAPGDAGLGADDTIVAEIDFGGGNLQSFKELQSFQGSMFPRSAQKKKHHRRKASFIYSLN